MQEDNRPIGGRFIVSLICFFLAAVMAILLLVTATTIWLSVHIGSFTLSALIVGVFFVILTILIYMLSIRQSVEEIRGRVETIYDVAQLAKHGYEWVSDKLELILQIRNGLRNHSPQKEKER